MRINYTINSQEVADLLVEKGELLMDAVADAMGLAGESLYEAIMYNMTGGIIHARTGLLSSSVVLSAVVRLGPTASVWCEIPDIGSFEHLVGMVLEFGGTEWYDIFPLEVRFAEHLGPEGGAGKESMFSAEESIALIEGRLPHALRWVDGGGEHFAAHVHHPPSKEFAYMRTSLGQVEETVRAQITEALAGVIAA